MSRPEPSSALTKLIDKETFAVGGIGGRGTPAPGSPGSPGKACSTASVLPAIAMVPLSLAARNPTF